MGTDGAPKASDFPNPHFVQGSDAPVFRGSVENGLTFQCSNCGHILIENYVERNFLSVEIKCFRCQTFTMTPPIEPGEVFSLRLVNMGHEGAFRINGTVDAKQGVAITCSQALAKAAELTSPRSHGLTLDFSEDGISFLIKRYDEITGQKFDVQNKILSRSGDKEALRFPFAWAVRQLQLSLAQGVINIGDPKVHFSLTWLRIFVEVVGKWQHHPRFIAIARDLGKPDSFLHTAAQFIIATYLYENGNEIGLSLENLHGEPNPDLYVRGVHHYERIYLEIKAPKKLHHLGQPIPSELILESPVKACIEGSVKQINKHRPGALVMFSGLQDRRAPAELERCVTNWLNRYGRNRKSLAAVVAMSIDENRIFRNGANIHQPLAFRITPILNPYFEGEPLFRTE
jgi:phage FluMu protein Com